MTILLLVSNHKFFYTYIFECLLLKGFSPERTGFVQLGNLKTVIFNLERDLMSRPQVAKMIIKKKKKLNKS